MQKSAVARLCARRRPTGAKRPPVSSGTRQQHAQERVQDCMETIADLIASCGEARATELAKSLGVTRVTVIRTVERLQREGGVTTRPCRSICLTGAGRRLAAKEQGPSVIAFLEALGVSPSIALVDEGEPRTSRQSGNIGRFREFSRSMGKTVADRRI